MNCEATAKGDSPATCGARSVISVYEVTVGGFHLHRLSPRLLPERERWDMERKEV